MNVLLVDDDIAVIRILVKSDCWEQAGVGQVFCAYNAFEAKKIVENEDIQIIICDIEMPQENGIHFLNWVQKNRPRILNIIMTSYPDFGYAQEAISIGVYKFMLKPVGFDELRRIVGEAVLKVKDDNRKEVQRKYGEYYENNRTKAEKILYGDILMKEIFPSEQHIVAEIMRRGMEKKDVNPGGLVLFCREEQTEEDDFDYVIQFAFVNVAEELFQNVVAFNVNYDFIWIVKGEISEEGLTAMCRLYLEKVKTYLKIKLNAYFSYDFPISELAEKYNVLKRVSAELYKRGENVYPESCWKRQTSTTMDINPDGDRLIEKIQQYLKEHFMENITRNDIEESFHMNQDYLNRIFKQDTGYSLMEYVQFCRIKKAKELLKDNELAVSEIGGMIGYNSPPYFSKIFKKWTGVTPKEYRNNFSVKE